MSRTQQRVIACVIRRGARFLVCQRPLHKRHGGLWEFPGGKIEPGECNVQAAERELSEELGITLLRCSPALFEREDPGSHYVIAFVRVDVSGEPHPNEHAAMHWGTIDELLELPLAPSDRAFMEFLRGAPTAVSNG